MQGFIKVYFAFPVKKFKRGGKLRRRLGLLVLCLIALTAFSGCQRMTTPPAKSQRISATKQRADYYYGKVLYDVGAQTGMYGGTPTTYTVQGGNTVRIIGMYDGYYVAVLPNGQMGLMPKGSAAPNNPTPSTPIPSVPGPSQGYTIPTPSGGTPVPGPAGGTTVPTPSGGNPAPAPYGGTPAPTTPPAGTASGSTISTDASAMLNMVNQARTQAGLSQLTIDSSVARLANLKAVDMVNKNYFSHTSPTYGSPFDMMKTYGVSYLYAGENLAMNSNVQSAETALMNSSEHKANILNPNYTNIGIGVAQKGDGSRIYVQMFIGR